VKAINRVRQPAVVEAPPKETDHDLLQQIRDELRKRSPEPAAL
jgi:large-conductance mechanosensitive channel